MAAENENLENNDNTQQIETAEDAQALLDNLNKSEAEKSASIQDKEAVAPKAEEYELTVGGKVIKADKDKLIKWASMGYDAPNQIGKLNKELESWQQKEATLKELESKYKDVDDYVRQNPQWWQFIQQQYEQTKAQLNQANPLLQEFQGLRQQVEELAQYKNAVVMKQEDQAYLTELESIKKQYPKIDLHSPDESGKSLEYKILEHAQQNGIKKFSTAFKDFYHDELLKMKEEEAKEKFIKDKHARTKLGILDVSTTPTQPKQIYQKGKSYNELQEDVLKSLGIA